MLAEVTTTELTKATNPKGLEDNKKVAKKVVVQQEIQERKLSKKQEKLLLHRKMLWIYQDLLKMQ